MSINSTNNTANIIADLANQLFQRVDNDHDGKLNANEFQSFLTTLISQVTNRSTNGLGSEASASHRLTSVPPNGYQAMLGFDFAKLNDLTHTTPKYVFARATQNLAMGFTRSARSSALDGIVEEVRANG